MVYEVLTEVLETSRSFGSTPSLSVMPQRRTKFIVIDLSTALIEESYL